MVDDAAVVDSSTGGVAACTNFEISVSTARNIQEQAKIAGEKERQREEGKTETTR